MRALGQLETIRPLPKWQITVEALRVQATTASAIADIHALSSNAIGRFEYRDGGVPMSIGPEEARIGFR